MNTFQGMVKAFALLLAFVLILGILSFSVSVLGFLFGNTHNIREESLKEEYDVIQKINIDVSYSRIQIKKSHTFGVEAYSSRNNFHTTYHDGVLEIKEKKNFFPLNHQNNQIIIYVKEGVSLEDVDISFGAGKVEIDGMTSKSFAISGGAGTLDIKNSKLNDADIQGGAGKIAISSSILNNLDLEAGAGSVSIGAQITGNSKIECGVGSLSLHLLGDKSAYKIEVEKGIGSIVIDGKNFSNTVYGNGKHLLKLEGGIGSIKVDFK